MLHTDGNPSIQTNQILLITKSACAGNNTDWYAKQKKLFLIY